MGLPDVLDLAVLVLLAAAAVSGWRARGTRLVGGWTGLLLGAAVGTALASRWAGSVPDHRVLVVLGLVLLGALLGSAAGSSAGLLAARLLRRLGLSVLDRAAGAVLAAGLVLVLSVLALGALAVHGHGRWAAAAAASSTVQADAHLTPRPGDVAGHLARTSGLAELPALLGRHSGPDR